MKRSFFYAISHQRFIHFSSKICFLIKSGVKKPVNNCFSESLFLCRNFSVLNRTFLESREASISEPFRNLFSMSSCKIGKCFSLNDYDCIGFDLDNTICEYKLKPMVEMEYDMLAKFLVEKRGYDYKTLYQPLSEIDIDFFQKGLFLDFEKGNILKISDEGIILCASHGTTHLSEEDIIMYYGKEKRWDVTSQFSRDMLSAWNGPLTYQIRTLLDYFDMPASLLFARAVDSIDLKLGNTNSNVYNVGRDVLDALINLYNRDHFKSGESGYFKELKRYPDEYIKKCPSNVIEWLKMIKQSKFVFLITGSNIDYASFTASFSLGPDWKNLFDITVCYAKKPGFFSDRRPFYSICNLKEGDKLEGESIDFDNIYSQGNWQGLYELLKKKTMKPQPKCLYIGDNILQDIYTPSTLKLCDTLAVSEELGGECLGVDSRHPYETLITSKRWGSYFKDSRHNVNTLWGGTIRKHAKACVSNLKVLACNSLDFEINEFEEGNQRESIGYYPGSPSSVRSV